MSRRGVVLTGRKAGEARDLLEAAGLEVHHLPAIALCPPADPGALSRAVAEQSEHDDLVFTSAAAVTAFVEAAEALGVPTFGSARIVAVGMATARALEAAGAEVALVGEGGGAELAAAYPEGSLVGRRILLPRAEAGREEFPEAARAAGAEVTVVAAYCTLPRPEVGEAIGELIASGGVKAVCFASPSAVEAVAAGLSESSWESFTAVAIGETTASALRAIGVEPVVAGEPSGTGLAEAVLSLS
ncbi:MAG: uroporphyrinogen-III synthase [Deltaproteobacteria bacterium]|nr:uroporphyrinogen-III synthase [Deltaproteobacteria bacterium]